MFPYNAEYDSLTDEEKLKKTEKLFQIIEADGKKYKPLLDSLTLEIDQFLSSQDSSTSEKILSVMDKQEFIWCCFYSHEFTIFASLQVIIPLEKKSQLPYSFQSMKSLSDFVDCYTRLSFYFRRIEFDYPMEDYIQIVELINQYQLSPFFLYVTLTKGLFDRKAKIASQIANLYQCMNEDKWAGLFRKLTETT